MKHLGFVKAFAMSGGDWVIYLLIACSVLSIGIILERALIFRRRRAAGRFESDLSAALARAAGRGERPENVAAAQLVLERRFLEKRLTVINTLGNNAPFIGLLGTVLGVIRAFHDLAFSASAGPEVVMQGLSEALVATAVGILVALPCVIAYNLFQKAVEDRVADAEIAAKRLLSSAGVS